MEPSRKRLATRHMEKDARTNPQNQYPLPHPAFSNKVILDTIFRELINDEEPHKRDVCNVRLVCVGWRISMTRLYGSAQRPTTFGGDPQRSSFPNMGMGHFLSVMSASPIIPTQSYQLAEPFFQTVDCRPLFTRFLMITAQSARSISLHLSLAALQTTNIASLEGLRLQKLTQLHLHITTPNSDEAICVAPIGTLLQAAATSLKRFKLTATQPDESINDRLGRAICTNIPSTTTQLILDGVSLDERGLKQLIGIRGIKLQELQFRPSSANCSTANKLLALQAQTLSNLSITGKDPNLGMLPLELPVLGQLKTLTLDALRVKTFSPTTHLPALQELNIARMESTWFEKVLKGNKARPHHYLKTLSLPSDFALHPGLVAHVGKLFPSLSQLHFRLASNWKLGKATLKKIFNHIRNIRHLQLSIYMDEEEDALNLDSILTGLSETKVRKLRLSREYEHFDLVAHQSSPSILNMKGLQTLNIECEKGGGLGRLLLSDISAHFAFTRMQSLRNLQLPYPTFTAEMVDRMKGNLEQLEIGCQKLKTPNI